MDHISPTKTYRIGENDFLGKLEFVGKKIFGKIEFIEKKSEKQFFFRKSTSRKNRICRKMDFSGL